MPKIPRKPHQPNMRDHHWSGAYVFCWDPDPEVRGFYCEPLGELPDGVQPYAGTTEDAVEGIYSLTNRQPVEEDDRMDMWKARLGDDDKAYYYSFFAKTEKGKLAYIPVTFILLNIPVGPF